MRLEMHTQRREQMIDVTRQVQEVVTESGVSSGVALIFSPHTTAAVTITESADPDVVSDVLAGLAVLVPREGQWLHAEGNSDAHLKAVVVGSSISVPVADGRLALGTWQGIFLCEFDGPRRRTLSVTVTG